jgi:tripartite ATP-independent transporter DctM subunit
VVLVANNVPIAFSIGVSTVLAYLFILPPEIALAQVAKDMWHGIDSYALLAIPMFILAGHLMGEGGIARRLIAFSEVITGRLRAGLSYANVVACMLFGAISGSAAAAASSIGAVMIPEMEKAGYKREYSTALTTTAATLGLVIPPSNVMIVYAVAWGNMGGQSVDVAAMFIGGFLPGIIIGLALMVVAGFATRKQTVRLVGRVPAPEAWRRFLRSLPGLMMMVIVLGGIMLGYFTATEASAVAVVYALFLALALYRSVTLAKLWKILSSTAMITGFIFILIAASKAMGNLMVRLDIPQMVTEGMLGLTENRVLLLLILNVILLVVGTFMDITPAVLIFTPMFGEIAVTALGMHPIHFGLILIINLSIGLCTPPVGTILFVGCGVGRVSIARLVKPLMPFYAAMLVALLIVTYLPGNIILGLPRMFSNF